MNVGEIETPLLPPRGDQIRPMKDSKLSRLPILLLPNSTSVWSTPSMGRSVGILLPMSVAKLGKEVHDREHCVGAGAGLILAGPTDKQNVLIDPSVTSPNSPQGPELPMSGVPWLPISRAVWPCGPLSEAKTSSVLSSISSSFSASRIWPTWWSPSMILSPY